MAATLPGIHHVTAICSDPQRNVDFYCRMLGLRLVKLTVNFDDPSSYHLYYGDERGRPGTLMTFFAWPGAYPGRIGPPQVTATAFAAPREALGYWSERLKRHEVTVEPGVTRFGEPVLSFADPDGLAVEIVATAEPGGDAPSGGPAPAEHAIRGFYGVTLSEEGYEKTARLLTETLGFRPAGSEGNRFRYRAQSGESASVVDLLCAPDAPQGATGAGVVHHVAFRTPTDAQQQAWQRQIAGLGYNVTPVMDRTYFHSIYFREPGGVLIEIATDPPGFTVDEAENQLGTNLRLPSWLETQRPVLERVLPRLRLPEWHPTQGAHESR
jgi:catechol 2,3-dioxygenase-like lactoylglutathione lyase family enzyme